MITLLFALFIVLYAMSKLNESKFQQLSRSLARAITHQDNAILPGTVPPQDPSNQGNFIQTGNADSNTYQTTAQIPTDDDKRPGYREEERQLESAAEQLQQAFAEAGMPKSLQVQVQREGLVIRLIADKILFKTGDAEVRPEGRKLVALVTRVIRPLPNAIRIEGNTDNVPIRGGRFHSNWELSTMRATNVAEVMIVHGGINPERVSVVGYGQVRPLVPNTTAANRALNRRVEIVLTRMYQKSWK